MVPSEPRFYIKRSSISRKTFDISCFGTNNNDSLEGSFIRNEYENYYLITKNTHNIVTYFKNDIDSLDSTEIFNFFATQQAYSIQNINKWSMADNFSAGQGNSQQNL